MQRENALGRAKLLIGWNEYVDLPEVSEARHFYSQLARAYLA